MADAGLHLLRFLFEVAFQFFGEGVDGFLVALVEGVHEGIVDELAVAEVVVDEGDVEGDVDQDVQVAACAGGYSASMKARTNWMM